MRDFVSSNSLHHEIDNGFIPAGRNPEWLADMVGDRHAFPDLRVEIQDQIAENDQVVTRLRMRGTQNGPLLGIGASGKAMDVSGVRIDRLAQGKITESWFHWDGLGNVAADWRASRVGSDSLGRAVGDKDHRLAARGAIHRRPCADPDTTPIRRAVETRRLAFAG